MENEKKAASKPSRSEKIEPTELNVKIEFTPAEKENKILQKGRITEYTVPLDELDSVHVELEQVEMNLDANGMAFKKSNPYIQKYNAQTWLKQKDKLAFHGFTHIRVLYAPKGVDITFSTLKQEKKALFKNQ